MQTAVKEAFGIRPDQVVQGKGTTNTGNLARRCFEKPRKFAQCLGVDKKLVSNVALILKLLRSKRLLNVQELEILCETTRTRYFKEYPWASMSPSFHRLLVHSGQIIQSFWPIPISSTAEDGLESWHKKWRAYFTSYVGQMSHESRLLDATHRAHYETDPVIAKHYSSLRRKRINQKKFPPRVKKYFMETNPDDFRTEEDINERKKKSKKRFDQISI